jgi:hypothetical protein
MGGAIVKRQEYSDGGGPIIGFLVVAIALVFMFLL